MQILIGCRYQRILGTAADIGEEKYVIYFTEIRNVKRKYNFR